MVNYNNALIYKLCCKNTEIKDIYIGSTTNFTRRKHNHKSSCNNINSKSHTQYKYQFIRDNGGWDNWDMILIEKVNGNDKLELRKKEREYIEKFNSSLNSLISYRNIKEKKQMNKEYLQNYRTEHKEELKDKYNYSEKRKIHYQKNKERIINKTKEYYENNKEILIEKGKIYYQNNKEKKKEYDKIYRANKK
tara:strand:+ start:1488 stop:2063 length:576 start_codon:yes stop_codon:yes gene_type:complete